MNNDTPLAINDEFDWVPFFEEVAEHLLTFENRQLELIELLKEVTRSELLHDKIDGKYVPLTVMDPFSFFASILRFGDRKRYEYFAALREHWQIESLPPRGYAGVPNPNNQNTWFFGFSETRSSDDIDKLWQFFSALMKDEVDDALYQSVLDIYKVGPDKMTEGIYWMKPRKYFPIDGPTRWLLTKNKVAQNNSDWRSYLSSIAAVKSFFQKPFYKISHQAYVERLQFKAQEGSRVIELPELPKTNPSLTSNTFEMTPPLNQILYGPPGTGKTYRTISEAVKIANPFFQADPTDRGAWTNEYQRLVKEGRIVFTTFHQSLSYEDFVEGIKPETTEEGQVTYDERLGVFRSLCTEAAYAIHELINTGNQVVELDFGDRFDAYLAHVQEMLEEGKPIKLLTKAGKGAEIVGVTDRGNIQVKHDNGEKLYTISKDRQVRLDEGITDFDDLPGNIYTVFASIIGGSNASMHWAVMNAVREFMPPAKIETKVKLNLKAKAKAVRTLMPDDFGHPSAPNYVLIIDEINRGNVSRIFGELITLLEPDKRLGREEALTVTLPYSRDTFGVPPNLYIIGTMNTADRSVVALDSALRRRFRFTEVAPDPAVIGKVLGTPEVTINSRQFDLVEIMTAINNRIEFLRDRDHLIGHSYFLKMKTAADVAEQFTTGIVPLLREYFYEDYGQLLLVLGGKVIVEKSGKKLKFPTGVKSGDLGLEEYKKYTIADFMDENGVLSEALLADALDVLLGKEKKNA